MLVALTTVIGKLRVETEIETTGAGSTPVPVSVTACGEPEALSVILSDAVSVPPAVGLNVTEMAQEALMASDAPQVLVWTKEEAYVPVKAMLERVSVAVPVFLRVTVCVAVM